MGLGAACGLSRLFRPGVITAVQQDIRGSGGWCSAVVARTLLGATPSLRPYRSCCPPSFGRRPTTATTATTTTTTTATATTTRILARSGPRTARHYNPSGNVPDDGSETCKAFDRWGEYLGRVVCRCALPVEPGVSLTHSLSHWCTSACNDLQIGSIHPSIAAFDCGDQWPIRGCTCDLSHRVGPVGEPIMTCGRPPQP